MPVAARNRERPLTAGELALAEQVFGAHLDRRRVRVVRRRRGRFAFVLGDRIHVPPTAPLDFADGTATSQSWLIHELVHVWQFQTRPLRTLASWFLVALSGGYRRGLPGYVYRLPLKPWRRYNLEQQARLVEHRYLLEAGAGCAAIPAGATLAHYQDVTPFGPNPCDIMDRSADPTQA